LELIPFMTSIGIQKEEELEFSLIRKALDFKKHGIKD